MELIYPIKPNTMTLKEAKDKAAREYGRTTYKSVQISVFESNSEEERLNYIADLELITNRAMEIYAGGVVKWTPKNEFTPVDGQWYWAIIPKEDGSGWYLPQQAKYYNGEYHVWITRNDVPTLMQMPKFTHVAEIIYPKTTKP